MLIAFTRLLSFLTVCMYLLWGVSPAVKNLELLGPQGVEERSSLPRLRPGRGDAAVTPELSRGHRALLGQATGTVTGNWIVKKIVLG